MPQFRIDFQIDRRQADQATKAQIRQLQSLERQAKQAATAMQAAHSGSRGGRSGSSGANAAVQQNRQQIISANSLIASGLKVQQANERKALSAERAAQREARASQRAAAAQVRSNQQQVVSTNSLIASGLKLQQTNERRMRGGAKLLTQEEINARVAAQRIRNINQQRIESEMKVQGVASRGVKNSQAGADKLVMAVKGVAGAYLGLHSAVAILQAVGEGINNAALKQQGWLDKMVEMRDLVRESEGMRGKPATAQSALELARFSARSGLKEEEANAFQKGFFGSGEQHIGKGRNISEEQAKIFMQGAAALASTMGIDAGTMGDMAGGSLAFKDYNAFGKDAGKVALGELYSNVKILMEGRGDNAQNASELSKASAALLSDQEVSSVFKNSNDVATAVSMMGEANSEDSATAVKNLAGAVRSFSKKKPGELLKKAGVTPKMDPFEAIDALRPFVEAEAAETPGLKTQDVLAQYGFTKQERTSLATAFAKGQKVLTSRRTLLGELAGGLKPGDVGFDEALGTGANKFLANAANDPNSAQALRIANQKHVLAEREQAAKRPAIPVLTQEAETRLLTSGRSGTAASDATNSVIDRLTSPLRAMGIGSTAEKVRVQAEIEKQMTEAAKKSGDKNLQARVAAQTQPGMADYAMGFLLNPFNPYLGARSSHMMANQTIITKRNEELSAPFLTKGISPIDGSSVPQQQANAAADLKGAAADLRRAADRLGQPGAGGPKPQPAPPAIPQQRKAPGGVPLRP